MPPGMWEKGEFMSSKVRFSITTNDNAATVISKASAGGTNAALQALERWIGQAVNGSISVNIIAASTAVSATGSVTLSSFVATNTVTVNGTILTGSDTPSGAVQFATGVSDAASATALAACINAHTTLKKVVSAAVDSTTASKVNITCLVPGVIGNLCTLAISANGSVSGANLTGGSEDTNVTIAHGI